MPSKKPLKIADILEQQLEDPVMREKANREFQKHAAGFRTAFADVRDAVSKILARSLYEIAWFQEVPFVVQDMPRSRTDRKETWEEQEERLRGAIDRLETNQVEELRAQVARAIHEKLVDKLRVAIPKYLGSPGMLAIQQRFMIAEDPPTSGNPVRGQLRTVADDGYRPEPLDKRTGESMGRDKPKDE
ncbi:MAG TPA: hypothetical protein PKV72_02805 [Candidatus Peribacteria bacterium]|nr:hypothetical protein [Candidatus Peribacteria bacterium]